MNKEKIIVLFFLLACLLAGAQETGKRKQMGSVQPLIPAESRYDLFRKNSQPISELKPNIESIRLNRISSCADRSARPVQTMNVQKSTAGNSQLQGLFYCKGISYWGGIVSGETILETDPVNENKIWFSNLVPGASNKAVYGLLAADQKTISLPQGQQIYVKDRQVGTLTMYGSSADIKGTFDSQTGVITITSDLWGVNSSDGWYELFTGQVTYTRSDMMPPVASYSQPLGALFMGLVPDSWGGYYSSCIVGAPFSSWTWANTNVEEDVSYSWSSTDSISGELISSADESLTMKVTTNFYGSPSLTATNTKGLSSTFILGIDYKNKGYDSYSIAGGNAALLGFDSSCDYGVANLDNGFTLLSPRQGSYYFGTGASVFSASDYETLIVKYDEPLSTLYFEGINVYLKAFTAPGNTPFTMTIYNAEEDSLGSLVRGDFIATKSIVTQDVVPIYSGSDIVGYTMKFSGFKVKDEDGFIINTDYVELNKAFLLELSGFNTPGVELGVCTEELNPAGEFCRSYHTVPDNDTIFHWSSLRQTMYFNLQGAVYSFIKVDRDSVQDPGTGGTYSFEAIPYFDTLYVANVSLPSWLHVSITNQEYTDENWGGTVQLILDPSDDPNQARRFDLQLATTGANRTIAIVQGGSVGTPDIRSQKVVKVSKTEYGYWISYPAGAQTLSVYTGSGQQLKQYTLDRSGSMFLSGEGLPRGICLLNVRHDTGSELIKVINY